MANLSSAIIEARKRHEAEIQERLKRRQQRQRAELDRLNTSAVEPIAAPRQSAESRSAPEAVEPAPPASARVDVVASAPSDAARVIEPPVQAPRLVASIPTVPIAPTVAPAPQTVATEAPHAEEVETLPDGRFLRVRNDIIDRIKPFLSGNQFAVYMELYRQTIGRGKTSAWFRTRDIQTACNLGSDNTVRDAFPVLEQKRLIRLDPNRRPGSPKGLLVTVLSVERALERLERARSAVDPRPVVAAPYAAPAPAPILVEQSGEPLRDHAGDDLVAAITRRYGVSPTVAPHLVDLVPEQDLELLPYLFARLDRSVASGKVHNPAGLLRVWLESFASWRGELDADRRRDEELRRAEQASLSRDELMLEWFKETEAKVQERVDGLDPETRSAMRARGRDELLAKSPAVRTWNERQWETQLDTYVKGEIRRDLESFDEWLRRTGRG
jgi:hypothetical protein